ncbi:MAG: helix-turn-helix domain-containing protein [Actinomycetota bacterium]
MPTALVRKLTKKEHELLEEKLKDKKMPVRNYERYRIIKEASEGRRAAEIADRVGCHFTVVYDWTKRFNTSGFSTFERPPNPEGRASSISSEQVRKLIRVALSRPEDLGLPFTTWSVKKLNAYCRKEGILPEVTDEWVRRLLRREGITHQRTGTWKRSPDSDFEVKKTAS